MDFTATDATATVKVRGLGIAAFSSRNRRFENALFRHGKHTLRVAVTGPEKRGGKIGKDKNLLSLLIKEKTGVEIRITTIGTPETQGFAKYTPGWFDRLFGSNDPNDLRWVLNFGRELHGNQLVKNTNTLPGDKPPVSRLYIENALFYSEMRTPTEQRRGPFFLRLDPSTGMRTPFGYMAERFIGRIKAEAVVLEIITPSKTWHETYEHVEGRPFTIEISNVDESTTASPNDVKVLYKFLMDPYGKEYDLEGWVPYIPKKGGSSSGMNYCHDSDGDGDGIDDFLP